MFENGQIFSLLHSKLGKTANMTPQFFPQKNKNGYKKTQNFVVISNLLMPTLKNDPKKVVAK
jgi:hypothetical protein